MFAMIPWPGPLDWVTYQKNNSHNGFSDQTISGQFVQKWSKQSSLSHFEMPLYQDGIFYFTEISDSTGDFSVYAIKKDDNTELWRYSGQSQSKPAVRMNRDYVIISGDKLIALNVQTGSKAWEAPAPANSAFTNMTIDESNIYVWKNVASGGFILCVYDIASGTLKSEASVADAISVMDPTINSYDSYVTYNNIGGTVIMYLDTYSGQLFDPLNIEGIAVAPVVIDDFGYITTSGSVTPIDFSQYRALKTFPAPSATIVVSKDYRAYFLSNDLLTNSIRLNSLYVDYNWDENNQIYYTYDYQTFPLANGSTVNSKATPIIVGDKIYFGMKNGEVWSVNLDGSGLKKYRVAPNGGEIRGLILANDIFVATSLDSKTLYAFTFDSSIQPSVTLNSPYKNDGSYGEYLGQLHDHYIPDILPKKMGTPSKTVQKYKDAGYDFVGLTEHNLITPNPNVGGITFIENAEEDTQGSGGDHILAVGINSPIDEKADDQSRINQISAQNGFSSLAHPNSTIYNWKINNLVSLENLKALEIYNYGEDAAGKYLETLVTGAYEAGRPFALDKWDTLLSNRKIVYATAGDDYTPGNPGFDGGAVVVLAKNNSQAEIMDNLKAGNFYAVQGSKAPKIKITTEGQEINIESNQAGTVKFIGNGGQVFKESNNAYNAVYETVGNEVYIRAEVTGNDGLKSWSQPIFVDKKQEQLVEGGGDKTLAIDSAVLSANTSDTLSASTLGSEKLPEVGPQWGYLSSVYDLATSGELIEQAKLTIDYSKQTLLTAEDNLSIFTYNVTNNLWEKVASVVDKVNKTVTANLNHFSLYTLSSDQVGDTIAPTLELANIDELESISGEINLIINAVDNSQVYNISGYLDKKTPLFSDSDYADGFDQTIDFSKYPVGKHKLTLIATDTFGNQTTKESIFKILDPNKTPQIKIIDLKAGKNICKKFVLRGRYLNSKDASQINIFLGNTKLGDVPVKAGNFSYTFDPSTISENQFIITVKVKDKKGQTVIKKIRVQKNCSGQKRRVKSQVIPWY